VKFTFGRSSQRRHPVLASMHLESLVHQYLAQEFSDRRPVLDEASGCSRLV